MNILGVILARGGSTRIPEKNLQVVGNMPLVAYAAAAAREAILTDVVVSTDDARIAAACEPFGAQWIRRPQAISGPESTIEDAIQHALVTAEKQNGIEYDYVVALQAAVPLRPHGAIRCLLNLVIESNARGGVTMVRRSPWQWKCEALEHGGAVQTWWNPRTGYPRSQDVAHTTLEEVNCIQITPRAEVLAGKRWSSPLAILELPKWADHDIDNPEDLEELRADWPVLAHRLHEPRYRYRLVVHPNVPKVQIPPSQGMHKGRIGVVLGNGPHIDTLGKDFFDKIRSPQYLSIGVNRVCCSETAAKYDFAPDLHLIWDSGNRGNAQTEAQIAGLKRLEGRTWRLIGPEPDARLYPHDQILENDYEADGHPKRAKLWNHSTDAAVGTLYRLGIREIYLYGVEMNDNRHFKVAGLNEEHANVAWNTDEALQTSIEKWKEVRQALPDSRIWCACQTSELVKRGVFEYLALDTARNYE